jgi:hypothetical protein
MNTAHSNYTGRAHRSLEAAFGPYTSNQLEPMPDDDVTDVALVLAAVAAVALTVLAIVMWGWA